MNMTKKQAAWFFAASTALFLVVFIVLTVHSHGHFPELTRADQITEQVLAGKDHWHAKNCVNCHTLLGEGAYFAPDLTKITQHRGEAYLTQFFQDPARFYDEEEVGRLMSAPDLTEEEIREVIAFLDWIASIQNQNWPPRPIMVSGSALPGAFDRGVRTPTAASDDPVALGEELFHATPPGCFACHSTSPGVSLAGPPLANMATRAAERIAGTDYQGAAGSAEAYVRESILQPSVHLVPGEVFSFGGLSVMPANYDETLSGEQVGQLVAYLMTLR